AVPLHPVASLRESVGSLPAVGETTPMPQTFEQRGVEDGIVAHQARIDVPADATVDVDTLHDRATVFVDDERVGTLERDGQLSLALPGGARRATLTVVVESLGRINYGPRTGEGKGIMHGVRINGRRYVHG